MYNSILNIDRKILVQTSRLHLYLLFKSALVEKFKLATSRKYEMCKTHSSLYSYEFTIYCAIMKLHSVTT